MFYHVAACSLMRTLYQQILYCSNGRTDASMSKSGHIKICSALEIETLLIFLGSGSTILDSNHAENIKDSVSIRQHFYQMSN